MTSYCESKNRPVFDWSNFISRAAAGNINSEELAIGKKLSVNWTQCACGNQSARIERDQDGIPKDYVLVRYGMVFSTAIHSEQWEDAARILQKIEDHAITLIN